MKSLGEWQLFSLSILTFDNSFSPFGSQFDNVVIAQLGFHNSNTHPESLQLCF